MIFHAIWVTPAGLDLTFHVQSTEDFDVFYQICDAEFETIVNKAKPEPYLKLIRSLSRNDSKLN